MVASPPLTALAPERLPALDGRRIAVVGADGFIGSHVVRLALRAGARVEAVLLQEPWRITDLDDSRLRRVQADRARLGERRAIPPLRSPEAVIWLAYVPPPPGVDALEHERRVNTAAAALAPVSGARVVFASTADVYGAKVEGAATEGRPPAPERAYAVAKLEAEELLGDSGPVLRLATVFGPGENGQRAIPSFIRALSSSTPALIHGTGQDVRDYVHVSVVAAAFLHAAVAPTPAIVNVGSGRGRTTLDVLKSVASVLDVPPNAVHVDSPRPPTSLVLDVARLRSLDVEPETEFVPALAEEALWLVAHAQS